jgi:translation initiation factor IF-2
VTIMGHVDHGKTTLLDTIRKANVAAGEAGAITQHISSYQVEFEGKEITFVDTPGHEAFTAMRARGTQLADTIILVVSATEGPKPQTVEVIERAKLTKTPLIVAINKIDLPEADIEKTKADIAAFGIVPEEWGGDTPYIPISGKQGTNIDTLLHTITLMAEVAGLQGQVDCQAQAVVVESHLDKNQGNVAVVLVTKDAIHTGDYFAFGEHTGKIRKMVDGNGTTVTTAKLCAPVEISGLSEVANTGESMFFFNNSKDAQAAASLEKAKKAHRKIFFSRPKESHETDIKLILKTDVLGSLEALKESIIKIPQEKVKVLILSESVGELSDSDVEFGQTTGATILAFHTPVPAKVGERAKQNQVGLIHSDVIYELLEWIEEQILARTKHEVRAEILGTIKVLAVFKSEKPKVVVFGGEVISGKITDTKMLRVIKNGEETARFEIIELQKSKVKTKEVNISQQFGVSCTGRGKVEVGDIVECIDEVVIK